MTAAELERPGRPQPGTGRTKWRLAAWEQQQADRADETDHTIRPADPNSWPEPVRSSCNHGLKFNPNRSSIPAQTPASPRKSAPAAGAAGPIPRRRHLERTPPGPQEAASGPRAGSNGAPFLTAALSRTSRRCLCFQPPMHTKIRGFRLGVRSETFRGPGRFDPPASPGGRPRSEGRARKRCSRRPPAARLAPDRLPAPLA